MQEIFVQILHTKIILHQKKANYGKDFYVVYISDIIYDWWRAAIVTKQLPFLALGPTKSESLVTPLVVYAQISKSCCFLSGLH